MFAVKDLSQLDNVLRIFDLTFALILKQTVMCCDHHQFTCAVPTENDGIMRGAVCVQFSDAKGKRDGKMFEEFFQLPHVKIVAMDVALRGKSCSSRSKRASIVVICCSSVATYVR